MSKVRQVSAAVGIAALATFTGAGIAAAATASNQAPQPAVSRSGVLTAMPGVFPGAFAGGRHRDALAGRADNDAGDDRGGEFGEHARGDDRGDEFGEHARGDDGGDEHHRGRGPGGPGSGGHHDGGHHDGGDHDR